VRAAGGCDERERNRNATLCDDVPAPNRIIDRRLEALGVFVAAYEAEHGEITSGEIRDAARRARGRAVVAGPKPAGTRKVRKARRRT
jgi:hypothetical protein